jgi:hypothetical protein
MLRILLLGGSIILKFTRLGRVDFMYLHKRLLGAFVVDILVLHHLITYFGGVLACTRWCVSSLLECIEQLFFLGEYISAVVEISFLIIQLGLNLLSFGDVSS